MTDSGPDPSIYTTTRRPNGVLESPELLELIFSFVDVGTAARCVTVCKTWFEPAAVVIWEHFEIRDLNTVSKIQHLSHCNLDFDFLHHYISHIRSTGTIQVL